MALEDHLLAGASGPRPEPSRASGSRPTVTAMAAIAQVEPLTTARALRGPFDYLLPEALAGVGVGSLLSCRSGAGGCSAWSRARRDDRGRARAPRRPARGARAGRAARAGAARARGWPPSTARRPPARSGSCSRPGGHGARPRVARARLLVAELTAAGRRRPLGRRERLGSTPARGARRSCARAGPRRPRGAGCRPRHAAPARGAAGSSRSSAAARRRPARLTRASAPRRRQAPRAHRGPGATRSRRWPRRSSAAAPSASCCTASPARARPRSTCAPRRRRWRAAAAAIVLVPEIALTPQIVAALRGALRRHRRACCTRGWATASATTSGCACAAARRASASGRARPCSRRWPTSA